MSVDEKGELEVSDISDFDAGKNSGDQPGPMKVDRQPVKKPAKVKLARLGRTSVEHQRRVEPGLAELKRSLDAITHVFPLPRLCLVFNANAYE
jgi:hypothetical protein